MSGLTHSRVTAREYIQNISGDAGYFPWLTLTRHFRAGHIWISIPCLSGQGFILWTFECPWP